jgi:hypothetical protein
MFEDFSDLRGTDCDKFASPFEFQVAEKPAASYARNKVNTH